MALNTVSVTIDLATTAATVAGFGTQLFISSHHHFGERVKTYETLDDASDIPTTSPEYAALTMHFAQSPTLPIKLGRRNAGVLIVPTGVTTGAVYTLTVTVNDEDTVTASYTAIGGDSATQVATELYNDIAAASAVMAHITATNPTGQVTLVEDSINDFFIITGASSNLTITNSSATETPAETLDQINLQDTDYYGITFNETDVVTVKLMAAQAEARNKLFLYCTSDVNTLSAWNGTDESVDILADLNLLSRRQTVGIWHHEAQDIFPEVGVFAYFAGRGYQPGTIAWNWKTISGVGPARHPTTNEVLSSTYIANIKSRNANTFEREAVGTIFGQGCVCKGTGDGTGEWIEHVIAKDFLIARITEAYKTKFYNLNKISFSSVGINSQKATLATVLDRYVETETTPNILDIDRPYELIFPKSTDVSFAQKASQVLPVSFKAYLSGTQTGIILIGTLTYNASV